MKMQTAVFSGVITAAMVAGVCFSQDAPQNHRSDSTRLLAALRSNDPHTRVGAVEQIRSDSAMLQDPDVQSALLDLLDLETREGNERVREGERMRAEHRDDNSESSDDNAMYMDDVLRTIESFANLRDARQLCLLMKAAAVVPKSADAHENATRAQLAVPCLQQLSQSDLFMDRLKAAKISVHLLASLGDSLDPDTAAEMKKVVVLALHDKEFAVRIEAVDWLGRLGKPDMIPVLREIAESSSGTNATEEDIAVTKNAAKAITAIQQRENHK